LCNSRKRLQAHHRRYPPYGAWHLDCIDNLTTLCAPCHERETDDRRERRYLLRLRARRWEPWKSLAVTIGTLATFVALIEWHQVVYAIMARCH
jgi:hypothetical protein